MTARRLPVPATFLVVVSVVIFLIIFFGAWAVSANDGGGARTLAFGFASSSSLNATALNSSGQTGLVEQGGDAGSEGDGWWQTAFLKACPFH